MTRLDPFEEEGTMFLLAGYSQDARALLDHLDAEAPDLLRRVVIVDLDPRLGEALRPRGATVICGDPTDLATLLNAGAHEAQMVVVFPPDPDSDDRVERLTRALRRLCSAALYVQKPGGMEWAIGAP